MENDKFICTKSQGTFVIYTMKKILLISPPSSIVLYKESQIKEVIVHTPYLSLACLAATLLEKKHKVKILDLALYENKNPIKKLKETLEEFKPELVGVSFTTPLYDEMKIIVKEVKSYNKNIITIGGGPHCTSLPKETLEESELDIVVIGEGDYTIVDIAEGKDLSKIKGIGYKKNNKIFINKRRDFIMEMDKLPLPAWHLFEIEKYEASKLRAKVTPVGSMESSRGCPYQCKFCNKLIHGINFRPKSAKRVVDEIEYMLKFGFKEIYMRDDGFAVDTKRAIEICDLIIKKSLKFSWNLVTGVRVNKANLELFKKLKMAGCHSIGFGIESGSQHVLNSVNKQINLEEVRNAIKWCKEAGIEGVGFFIIGFPEDTKETIEETINFAKSVDIDMAKVTILMPFPGTAIFEEMDKQGLIITKDWSKYNYHSLSAKGVFRHPNLDWDTIFHYQKIFYRKFYFRPKKILEEGIKGIKNRDLFEKLKVLIKTKW